MNWLPSRVRASVGTAAILGLDLAMVFEKPTTAYLQTFYDRKCSANCRFCAQARNANANLNRVARALYPPYPTNLVLKGIRTASRTGRIKRVCIQTVNYRGMVDDLASLIEAIRKRSKVPISASVHPIGERQMARLQEAGATDLVIPLDACTEEIFQAIKGREVQGPYRWDTHLKALRDAVELFGPQNVGTHLIIGLGEKELDAVQIIERLYSMGVYSALFAFTPIPNTPMEDAPRPSVASYRMIQLAYYLISVGYARMEDVEVDEDGVITGFRVNRRLLSNIIHSGRPFQATGCTDCNRPFATESPEGITYNYPRRLRHEEIRLVKSQLRGGIDV